ncbi:MAG: DoxX family protein [Akkermansiaceae bacterium]|nr:DoxX family protein [Akkermansiaceae bacterium]
MSSKDDVKKRECSCGRCLPRLAGAPFGVALLRLGVGVLMLVHGIPKVWMLASGQWQSFPDPVGIGSGLSLFLAAFAECVCSLLLMAGFMTRLAAFVLTVNFCVIVFAFDAGKSWADTELAAVYLLVYAVLMLTGAGRFSVDGLLECRDARMSSRGEVPPA